MDLFIVPPSEILRLKTLNRTGARKLLEPYQAKLSPEEYQRLLGLSQPDTTQVQTRVITLDPGRKFFLAAAWVVGASYQQLGVLFSVRRQTMQDQVETVLPKHIRDNTPRLLSPPLQWELLQVMRDLWEANRDAWGADPVSAAPLLLTAAKKQLGD